MLNSAKAPFVLGGVAPDWITLVDTPDDASTHTLEMFFFTQKLPTVLLWQFYASIDDPITMTHWWMLAGEVLITRNVAGATIITAAAGWTEDPLVPVKAVTVGGVTVHGFYATKVVPDRDFALAAAAPDVPYTVELISDGGTVQGLRNYNDVDDEQFRSVMIPGDEYTAAMQAANNTFVGTFDGGASTTFSIIGIYRLNIT